MGKQLPITVLLAVVLCRQSFVKTKPITNIKSTQHGCFFYLKLTKNSKELQRLAKGCNHKNNNRNFVTSNNAKTKNNMK